MTPGTCMTSSNPSQWRGAVRFEVSRSKSMPRMLELVDSLPETRAETVGRRRFRQAEARAEHFAVFKELCVLGSKLSAFEAIVSFLKSQVEGRKSQVESNTLSEPGESKVEPAALRGTEQLGRCPRTSPGRCSPKDRAALRLLEHETVRSEATERTRNDLACELPRLVLRYNGAVRWGIQL